MIRLHSSASKGQGTKTMETGGRGARLPTTTARVIPSSPFNAIHYSTYLLGGAGVHWRCKFLQVGTGATATAPVSSQLSLSVVSRVLSNIAQGAPPCSCSAPPPAGALQFQNPAGGGRVWLLALALAPAPGLGELGPGPPGSWVLGPGPSGHGPTSSPCSGRAICDPAYFLPTSYLHLHLHWTWDVALWGWGGGGGAAWANV
jgi:hypothetical protein